MEYQPWQLSFSNTNGRDNQLGQHRVPQGGIWPGPPSPPRWPMESKAAPRSFLGFLGTVAMASLLYLGLSLVPPPRSITGPLGEHVAAAQVLLEGGRTDKPLQRTLHKPVGNSSLRTALNPRAWLLGFIFLHGFIFP